MNDIADNTPVIIGVGQFSERVGEESYKVLSHMDLAGEALKAAITDAGSSGDLADAIDTLGAIRQFEISTEQSVAPFGKSDNPPRSIAKRAGADPERAVLEITGGQGSMNLLGEFATAIAKGESHCAAVVGSEAISTALMLAKQGEKPDWSEEVGGQLEDRGYGMEGLFDRELVIHGAGPPIPAYAILDNARRARLGLSLEEYRQKIGELFAPFTKVAAANPHAAAPVERSAEELATVTERNRIVAEPYPRMTVARDQVNQGAAVIIASAAKARELGVPEDRWVHIHSLAAAKELPIMERPDLSRSPASTGVVDRALQIAGTSLDECQYLDFYSCFAIPVFNQIDHFGLSPDDLRGLTLTGGLPFFGGAGNNYSTHGLAEAVGKVRGDPGSKAMVFANGGVMSKLAAGVFSTEPADWSGADRFVTLADAKERVTKAANGSGEAVIESYTVIPSKTGATAVVVARNEADERLAAHAYLEDAATRAAIEGGSPFGVRIAVEAGEGGRNTARVVGE